MLETKSRNNFLGSHLTTTLKKWEREAKFLLIFPHNVSLIVDLDLNQYIEHKQYFIEK